MNITDKIAAIVGEDNIFTNIEERLAYSRDMSVHEGIPDLLVFAHSTEEVSRIMQVAYEARIPVTARGSGTSVTGAVLPARGGILLDLSRMNKIKEINLEDFYAVVEPGVICGHLNMALAKHNMFFPPDPGSSAIASIGGMVSTNASGLRAVKYGTTKDYVRGLEVVIADGRIIRTGTIAPKTSTGYDLTRLFVNTEGTLGIITEITVKIQPQPEYVAFATSFFPNLDDAGKAVTEILTSGIPLCAGEIMDRESLNVVREAMKMDVPDAEAMLIMEVDGHKAAVLEQIQKIEEICRKHHGIDVKWSDDPKERAQMWRGRAGLVSALSRMKPHNRLIPISEDLGVPIVKIPEAIRRAQEISKKYDLLIATFGHVGDGNVHTTFVIDLKDKEQWERLKPAALELVDLAFELNGTISAEHGTGLTRAPFIKREMGEALELMKTLKKAIDPENILNPGKMGLDEEKHDIYDYFAFSPMLTDNPISRPIGENEENEVLACVQCGFCRLGCPTFGVTGLESRNARGRNILAYLFMTGKIEAGPELANIFYECTTCGTCTYFCPAQIKVDEVAKACRKELYKAGYLPESYNQVLKNIYDLGNPFASSREDRLMVYPKEVKASLEEGTFPDQAEVLLFLGCVPSYVDMKMVPSLIKIMEKAGITYTSLGKEESCCGFPIYLSGSDEFEEYAKSLLEKLSKKAPSILVTPCPGCASTFRKVYSNFVELPFEVLHAVEYIDRLIQDGKIKFTKEIKKEITYHDPCDLGRHLGVYDAPRRILTAIPGIELKEMARNRQQARCCGAGGGVQGVNPELSLKMSKERIKDAMMTGADILVSACASCKDNFKKGLAEFPKEERKKLKVQDITELVLKAMGK